MNPTLCIDFYKTDHRRQYPKGTTKVYSNLTARSNRLYKGNSKEVVFFGLQMFIKDYLIKAWNENFFNKPKQEVISEYKEFMDFTLGKDSIETLHLEELHDLGYLPLEIKALPEGSLVPMKIPVLTITNTIDKFFWLVNYLETVLSTELWKPMVNATLAYDYRKTFETYAEVTEGSKEFILFQGHDFSARGLSNKEDGYRNSIAHLTSFCGTDTCLAIKGAKDFYNADYTKELVGTSVPATEHSVMCLGEKESEINTFKRLITEIYPKGVVSIVSDTWDLWKVLTQYTKELKEEILNRETNELGLAKVVFRPDSGDPETIICGEFEEFNNPLVKTPQQKGALECLWEVFGGTINSKGYKVLNPRVGLIYGDSITLERQEDILERMRLKGFSSDNIVFGIGSYTYQYSTRDTFGLAMKATYGVVNNQERNIFKDPITDSGTKKSAKGLLFVGKDKKGFYLEDEVSKNKESSSENQLKTVFLNGKLVRETSLKEIRERLW